MSEPTYEQALEKITLKLGPMTATMIKNHVAEIENKRRIAAEAVEVHGGYANDYVHGLEDHIQHLEAQLKEAERSIEQLVDDRDEAQEWADRLAYAVAPEEVIGEHSYNTLTGQNNPWKNAYEILIQRSPNEQSK